MKAAILLSAAAMAAANAAGQSAPAAPAPLAHTQVSFDLVVHAPVEKAMPLFGPEGERAWGGKHWDPKFIYPQPAADVPGAVFTINHGPLNAVWVNTLFDPSARHFQYVYFLPDLMVTVIDVRFASSGANGTAVNVVYTRTAVTPEGNEHVKAMSEGDRNAGPEWQQAIDEHLAQLK